MAKGKSSLPKDIAVGISKLAEATEKDKKELLKEMKSIIKEDDAIQKMDNKEAKIRFAWTILASRHSKSGGKDYYVLPLATPQVRKIKSGKFVGDLSCLAQEIETDDDGEEVIGDMFYANGTFWEDSAKQLRNIERGKSYKATMKAKEQKKGITLFGDPTFEEANHDFPDVKEFFEEKLIHDFKEIYIEEMDIHESKYDTDCRVLRVTVLKAEEGENDRGEYAYYEVVDDSILGHSTRRIYVNPDDLIYGQSSVLYSVGTVQIGKDEKVRWQHQFFVPEIAFKHTIETTPVNDDAVDLDLDEEKPKEEPKEEEESTEEDEEDDEDEIFAV